MPRKGSAYPIDKTWRSRVRERIEELGIGQNELARMAGVSKASLSEALSDESKQSTCVPQIHKALGWPPPQPLVLAPDAQELGAIYVALSDVDRARLLERARVMLEERRPKK